MAQMTDYILAAHVDRKHRAEILLQLDNKLRQEIQDEELFMVWLEEGIPDGIHSVEEIEELGISAIEFAEMWNLAEKLMNEMAKQGWEVVSTTYWRKLISHALLITFSKEI